MPKDTFKDVTIGDQRYRIEILSADVGNWCATQLAAGRSSNFDIFTKIQGLLLGRCMVYRGDTNVPMRIYDVDHRTPEGLPAPWLDPNLEI